MVMKTIYKIFYIKYYAHFIVFDPFLLVLTVDGNKLPLVEITFSICFHILNYIWKDSCTWWVIRLSLVDYYFLLFAYIVITSAEAVPLGSLLWRRAVKNSFHKFFTAQSESLWPQFSEQFVSFADIPEEQHCCFCK